MGGAREQRGVVLMSMVIFVVLLVRLIVSGECWKGDFNFQCPTQAKHTLQETVNDSTQENIDMGGW